MLRNRTLHEHFTIADSLICWYPVIALASTECLEFELSHDLLLAVFNCLMAVRGVRWAMVYY